MRPPAKGPPEAGDRPEQVLPEKARPCDTSIPDSGLQMVRRRVSVAEALSL